MCRTDQGAVFLNYCMEHEMPEFPRVDQDAASYWETQDLSTPPMFVYGFETPMEMEACLQPYVESTRLRRILVAEAFQNLAEQQAKEDGRPGMAQEGDLAGEVVGSGPLPAYVYHF